MQKSSISLAIIAKNEEANIERCIRSASFVDEVLVLDSGSEDRTVEIAKGLGATVVVEPWRGFAKQKMRVTELAKNDWVLSLDADEALSPEASEEVQKLLMQPLTADAYAFPRMTHYLGRWMRHSGMYPDYQLRLFNRTRAKWTDTNVHEHIVADKVVKLKSQILHWSFRDLADQVDTINRYSSLRAEDWKAAGKRFSLLKLVLKPVSKFIETYVLKRGFLDGTPGLIASLASSYATYLRWAKLYEKKF